MDIFKEDPGAKIADAVCDNDLPCKAVLRCKNAEGKWWDSTRWEEKWEKVCKMVVGNPVHMDVVLAKPQSSSAKFCFSAYMNQEFEMRLMEEELVMDKSMVNLCIDITYEEFDRCWKFMQALEQNKTQYDYTDALLLMPLAPKVLIIILPFQV